MSEKKQAYTAAEQNPKAIIDHLEEATMSKARQKAIVHRETETDEDRAASEYAAAIRARMEEEANHGLTLQCLIEREIPRPAEIRRIKRILENEERAKARLEAIRNRATSE